MKTDYNLAGRVIGAAMEAHGCLGPGFVESVYENALAIELGASEIAAERQKSIEVKYKEQCVGDFVADLVVDQTLIVELKAVQTILPIHEVQLVNDLAAPGIDEASC
jgi:GxxExxY protein